MQTTTLEFPLVLGRLLGALRSELRTTQRAFSSEVGLGEGTLAWIESGRANAYVAQIYLLERGFIARGVLTHHGEVIELLHELLSDLGRRGVTVGSGRVGSLADHDEVAALDRVVGAVVQRHLDWRRGGSGPLMVSDSAVGLAVALAGPVTKRKRRGKG